MSDTITTVSTSDIVVNAPTIKSDDLTIIVNGNEYSGWKDIQVTLRSEGFPHSFSVSGSIPPDGKLPVVEGNICVVKLGSDIVVTGYVDSVRDKGNPQSHTIWIEGRGKTQDLADCGAEWTSHQMIGGNALIIAQRLASYYGIDVAMLNGADPGPDITQFPLNYGVKAAEIIQQVARNAGLLAYEDNLGRLVLSNVGTTTAASGIAYGTNCEEWGVDRSMHDRFSEYVCCLESMDAMMELGGSDFYYTATDTNVTRHRRMYLVVDQVASDPQSFTQKRADWEAARRAGRSYIINATVDSWRDDAGALWMPNTLVPVQLPAADSGESLVISEVTFSRSNGGGTTANIVAMRKTAFTPEPIVLVPVNTAEFTSH